MTMLDSMRRHKGWLKWSLGIVAVTFVWFYVPTFFEGDPAAVRTTLATVDGREVQSQAFQRRYQQQLQDLRNSTGGSVDEDLIRQLNIPQRLIMQMVDSEAVQAEAARLGLTVSDAELAERITRVPGLMENGQFIGATRYRQLLAMQRPPLSPAQFEAELRERIVAEKLQAAVTGWIRVSDAEVDEEYRRRNEKVKLDLAVFTANQFRQGITPTDAEIQARFAAAPETYRVPEKRRARYLAVDAETLKNKQAVSNSEVEARYQANLPSYAIPEQLRASHILLKTEGKDEAAVRKQAESVLAKVRAGGDFAALARQYSEDEESAKRDGDLDYFGRGRLVKEFEDAAWALAPGQVSDLVKSTFGFHIIKLTDRKAAVQRSLADVRPQIEDQIKYEKAQAEVAKVAAAIRKGLKQPADLDRLARAHQLTVGDSGLFAAEEPLAGLGFAPNVSSQAFSMQLNDVSGELFTNQGSAFIALVEIKGSYLPPLDEVRDRVREDVIRIKAVETARARAAAMARAAGGGFAAAAKAAGVTVKTTELVTRGAAYPEVGVSPVVDDAVFALKKGQTSAPIQTESAVIVARVTERQDIDTEKAATERDTLRDQLLQERRGTFFAAYMTKAKQQMKITFNEAAIRAIIGG